MRFNEDLAAIHGYLCADGYVIRNPLKQKHKYYVVGFRNYNLKLLRDFQSKFYKQFNNEPKLRKDGRVVINSKEIYFKLIKNFRSFYSREWILPDLIQKNLRSWLRAFFDCEAWVECETGKNRRIGLESVNGDGLLEIQNKLKIIFDIPSIVKTKKKGKIFRLEIFGKENLIKFSEEIGFLHKDKNEKLLKAISSYVV